MNTQTIIAVLGILATTIFGVWAIAAAFRFNRSVRITYALDQIIALTDDITQNFQDLGVTFRGEPVSANLVLLKGYLINTGRRDISREMVEDKISLNVPADFEWVDCKVSATSPSLQSEAQLKSAQEVEFTTGLWKRKEYMKFEALAKVPLLEADPENSPYEKSTHRLRQAIYFTHRIADSDRIEHTRVPQPTGITKLPSPLALFISSRKYTVAIAVVFIVFGIFGLIADKFDLSLTMRLGYSVTIDGIERIVRTRLKGDKIILSGEEDFSRELSLLELNELPDKKAVVIKDNLMFTMGIVYFTLGLLLISGVGLSSMKDRRMLSLIASKDDA